MIEDTHGVDIKRKGLVEGTPVEKILLDTGCSKTLVRQELIPREKILEGRSCHYSMCSWRYSLVSCS